MMRDAVTSRIVRTTLDIDDDILAVARETARRDKRSIGDVISELARRSLTAEAAPRRRSSDPHGLRALGIEPLPKRGGIVTNELIDRLRDDSIY